MILLRNALIVATLVVLLTTLNHTGFACPNCYGDPESAMTDGMNMAILSLLGITGGVLAGIVGFFFFLRKRVQMLNRRFVNRLN